VDRGIIKYGLVWPPCKDDLALEMDMITSGGRWKNKHGKMVGMGLLYHFTEAIRLLWPHIKMHRWAEMIIENYLTHRTLVVIGPASSGKTCIAAVCVLLDYYCYPEDTTVIVCSTTKQRLEDRIWGEIKKLHKMAQRNRIWMPGHLIEGLQRLVTDDRKLAPEGRDFRNGIVGVPCLTGQTYAGLGSFAGLKNKRVRLLGDELSLLPKVFVDSLSNLDKNPDFKVVGLGNPKDTTDALGVLAEPAASAGGWEGGIDQGPKSKTWPTRRPAGICVQLVGSDSPNLNGKLGIPLITQEQIDRDVAFYGRDSLWFSMMNEGMMPRGQGSRRVLTRQMCSKFGAFDPPVWQNSDRKRVAFLDAAYRGVGGDRCVFGTLEFGEETTSSEELPGTLASALVMQDGTRPAARQILALTSIEVLPINPQTGELPEDQIVRFVREHCDAAKIPPAQFFFDSGMRTSLVTAFSRLWSTQVNSIDCGGKPTERPVSYNIDVAACDYYSKFITELWFRVRLIVESRQFRGMTDEVIFEFGSREWTMVGANKIEVEPKAKMKEKMGRSPDLADAVAVGCEGAIRLGFVIRKLVAAGSPKIDLSWKRELREREEKLWRGHQLNPSA
jgi:hypothetical protein